MNELDDLVEVLQNISDTLKVANYGASTVNGPGILEGGFMRLHDKLDSIDDTLSNTNDHLAVIAKALRTIADKVGSM